MKDLISQYQGTCHCGDVCFKIFTDSVFLDLYRCNCTLLHEEGNNNEAYKRKFFFSVKKEKTH